MDNQHNQHKFNQVMREFVIIASANDVIRCNWDQSDIQNIEILNVQPFLRAVPQMLSPHHAFRSSVAVLIINTLAWSWLSDSALGQGVEINFSDAIAATQQHHPSANSHVLLTNDGSDVEPQKNGKPYALILPGILGKRFWDRNLESGLKHSIFDGDTEIYDWTKGPFMLAANIGGCQQQVDQLVQRVIKFQQLHPDRPIFLIGHSGGCKMAIQILEQLPAGNQIERSVLLSPCMESNYNLASALDRTRSGIVSFYSPLDVPVSVPLTAAHGLTEGRLAMSATVTGFHVPRGTSEVDNWSYHSKLTQIKFDWNMITAGHSGGHFGWTVPKFVSSYIAPLLVNNH